MHLCQRVKVHFIKQKRERFSPIPKWENIGFVSHFLRKYGIFDAFSDLKIKKTVILYKKHLFYR
jgi:hypothetical protein